LNNAVSGWSYFDAIVLVTLTDWDRLLFSKTHG
jgi:hypothetical protein